MSQPPIPDDLTLIVPVSGMTCSACSTRLERGLRRLEGVVQADVSLAGNKAIVRYSPAQQSAAGVAEGRRAGLATRDNRWKHLLQPRLRHH